MKKVNKILSVLLSLIMIFSIIPMTSITASAATQVEQALAFAANVAANNPHAYDGYCLKFVGACYESAGYAHYAVDTAYHAGDMWIISTSSTNIPVGALVFFDYSWNSYAGHVGIYAGNGKMYDAESAYGGVQLRNFKTNGYRGWGWYGGIAPTGSSGGGTTPSYNYQAITAGSYYVKSNGQSTYNYLTVSETSAASGAGINAWTFMTTSRVQIDNNGGNFYTMKFPEITTANAVNVHTDSTYPTATTKVTNYKFSGSSTQSWGFDKVSGGYVIRCKANENMVLTCNGSGQATISAYSAGNANQIWSLIPYVSGTVQYNANGGSGAPSSQTKYFNQTLTLSSTKPTRTGYTFLGWSTSSTATSATYSSGGSYTNEESATLYAVWKAKTYTISYNANGGSGAPSSQTKTHGKTLTLSSVVPTRNGYEFLGWSTSSTATSATYSAGGSFTTNANTTLYAVWKQTTNSLTVNSSNNAVISNGGGMAYYTFTPSSTGKYVIYSTSDTDTKVYLYNSSGTQLSSDDDGGDGQNFRLQYNLNAGTTYRFGVQYYNSSKTGTIPFKFGRVYTVTYNANGGTGAPTTQHVDYGKNITVSDVEPVRDGYTFEGWRDSYYELVFEPGNTIPLILNQNITFTAVWSQLPNIPSTDGDSTYGFHIQEPSITTIRNQDSIVLHTIVDDELPEGYSVKWVKSNSNFSMTKFVNTDTKVRVYAENKGDTTFTAVLYDDNGVEVARDTVELYSKSGFFDKIGGFFRMLFGATVDYAE